MELKKRSEFPENELQTSQPLPRPERSLGAPLKDSLREINEFCPTTRASLHF